MNEEKKIAGIYKRVLTLDQNRRLENKNEELQTKNRRLHNFLNVILQTIKQFFRKLLHIGSEKDKDNVVKEITAYHKLEYYRDSDLHDIADGTSREDEVNDYIYEQNYEIDKGYDDRAYSIFKKSLIDSTIKYNNMPVKVRDLPYKDNKVQGFFHVISELDKKLGIRMYKDERVKYIPYISKMITEYDKCNTCSNNCTKIKVWTAPYNGKIDITKFYFEEDDYIVILEKRPKYYQLVSAYVVDRED